MFNKENENKTCLLDHYYEYGCTAIAFPLISAGSQISPLISTAPYTFIPEEAPPSNKNLTLISATFQNKALIRYANTSFFEDV